MRPLLHPRLVNGRTGDPALYIETLFEKRAILFDLGDIGPLSPRDVQRLDHVFVSHTHIDHFIGFDRLLRLLVGRDKKMALYGPPGFIANMQNKLHGYCWNLAHRYACDLVFTVTEISPRLDTRTVRLRLNTAFTAEALGDGAATDNVICEAAGFRVRVAVLEHRVPCLAFAIEENTHINIWKARLAEMNLPVGPWLRDLKQAVIENKPDDYPVCLPLAPGLPAPRQMPLAALRSVLTVTRGQKIAYATDISDTAANRKAIVSLARTADILFIEAAFAEADADLAKERAHLTTRAAGEIAREAGVRRVEPFHFSARYGGEEQHLIDEVGAAFGGSASGG